MKKIIIALILGFSGLTNAQNTVLGTVTDLQDKPILGVSVYVPELHKGTKTDENGKYNLHSLPKGGLHITFTFIGYTTQNKRIENLLKENELNVQLSQAAFEMDEVIVSTAFSKLQSQNVMKVEHETTKSLQRKGVSTLIEGLATIPGVSQISTGTSIGKPVIRGLSGNRVLVYSQGVRLENQQFGEEHGLGLNGAGIESVEVIKGPASLLYGSDALGGVLYFNPEKFANAGDFNANVSEKYFNNTLGSNSSIGLKTSTENWKFLLRGTFDTHSDYKSGYGSHGLRVTNTRYNETDVKAAVGYSDSGFSSILRYNYNNLDLGMLPDDGIAEQTLTKRTAFPKQGVFNHLLSLNNVIFFKDSKLDVDLGYVSNDRSEFEDSDVVALHMKLNTFNYNAKYHFPKMGKFETIAGVQGMYQTNANSGEEYLIPDATTNDFGVFGTSIYGWKTNELQLGLRFDNRNVSSIAHGTEGEEGYFQDLNKSFNSFNGSLGYKTNLADDLSLRLNVATGFRAPNLAELTSNGVHEGTNRYEKGNVALKTEQNVQADLDLEYKISHFEFFVNGFYNHINNYIYTSPTGEVIEENNVFDYIQNNSQLYGGEAGIHFHPHPLDWLHIETNFETVTAKKQNGDYLPLIPANNWNNTLRTEFKIANWLQDGYGSVNVSSTFNQDNVSGFETASRGYTLVNLGLGGTVKMGKTNLDINISANNLFDKKYIAHLSRLKTDGIPNIGRNIIFGVNFNL